MDEVGSKSCIAQFDLTMSPTTKKRNRQGSSKSPEKIGNLRDGHTQGKGAKRRSTLDEIQRLEEIRRKYLESSSDESEKSEDKWGLGDQEGEVDKIVDEMVDMCGNRRYKVQWKGWARKSDGTNTTWLKEERLAPGAGESLEEWKVEKKRRIVERRRKYAEIGYPLSMFLHGCFTRFNTTLEELGYGHDQELTPDMQFPSQTNVPGADWDKEIEETRATALAHIPNTSSWSPPQVASVTFPDDMDYESTPRGPRAPSHKPRGESSSTANYATPMSTPQENHVSPESRSIASSSKRPAPPEAPSSPPVRAQKRARKGKERRIESHRTTLQDAWDRATDQDGAARVVLVNEVDEELVPASIDINTFEYLERGSYRHDGTLTSHASFLTGCMCEDGCIDPGECLCQDGEHAEAIWEGGERVFAYDENGKYRFPCVAVTECNDSCQCDWTCRNRVAQRPRDVPLEIFKTPDRGWGVRATAFIAKGKVLGTFTGDLRPSSKGDEAQLARSKEAETDYELDWFNASGSHQWRVTAKDCGNWSRFLNHSCYPNLKVYAVVYDSIMNAGEDNRHRLAFVALQDIQPHIELTIDYSPQNTPDGEQCCDYGGCKPYE